MIDLKFPNLKDGDESPFTLRGLKTVRSRTPSFSTTIMDAYPERHQVSTTFRRERSTQRTAQVLEVKRQRLRDDLQQLVSHMGLMVPSHVLEIKRQRLRDDLQQLVRHMGLIVPQTDMGEEFPPEILHDALDRLGDEAFAECVRKILQGG